MSSSTLSPSDVARTISQIESSPAATNQNAYEALLSKILSSSAPDDLASNIKSYVESLLGDSVGIIACRPMLSSFVGQFAQVADAAAKIEAGQHVLELLRPRVVYFEEQDTRIKLAVADAHEELEDFESSARVLQTVTLDSPQRAVTADDKAQLWIRIVRCYLEVDQPEKAAGFLNRVKTVYPDVSSKETKLQFLLSQARILDSQRSFLDASSKYYEMSLETVVAEDERLMALSQAIICGVLAPAGPQRARTLAKLYKDDRAGQVEEYSILEKIFLDRLLSPAEVKSFGEKLQPHQLAKTADGSTVLDKAVLEHNLLAASRLYSNIGTHQLGSLLGVDADRAESYAAQMIEQDRLTGYIDQINGLIIFEGDANGSQSMVGQGDGMVGKELRKWDNNVQSLAEEVEKDFYSQHMVH